MIEPELAYNDNLKIQIDILNFVPFICCIIISDFFPSDIVEFTNLVQGVHWYFLKSLSMLPIRHQL